MPKLLDAVMFLNENEMFKRRMEYLDCVDMFIVVEANYTFSHNKKDYCFDENLRNHPKVDYVQIDLSSDMDFSYNKRYADMNSPAWLSEYKHRNNLMKPLRKYSDDSLVLFSDLDEIPNKHKLLEILDTYDGADLLRFDLEAYQFDFRNYTGKHPGTALWTNENVLRFTPQECRRSAGIIIQEGGWHLSYWGDAHRTLYKLQSFSHQEFAFIKDKEYVQSCMDNAKDLFGRTTSLTPLEVPQEILNIFS